MKILAYDIEASNLSADFGIILTFGSKFVEEGKKVEVLNILDYADSSGDLIRAEKRLLKDIVKRILTADVLLGHFSTYYDFPFINTRLLYHRLPVLPSNFPGLDTWKVARYKLKLRNNRLVTIQGFLGLKDEKNAIQPEQWIRALGGHVPSMDYIVEHNRRDVLVLEQAYIRLRPLITNHPRGSKSFACPVCGGTHIQSRGTQVTQTRTYKRFQCQNETCGHWFDERRTGKVEKHGAK